MISQASLLRPVNLDRVYSARMHALLFESIGQQPDDDWEIFALVVSGKNDRIFVGIQGVVLALHVESCRTFEGVHVRVASR